MNICIIDTTIMLNLLEVPGCCAQKDDVLKEFKTILTAKETLVLPLATIIETGNQIAKISGSKRYETAAKFTELLKKTADGQAPWSFAKSEVKVDDLRYYADNYLDFAKQSVGLGDLSIIRTYEKCKTLIVGGTVWIWSKDKHLAAYREDVKKSTRRNSNHA